MTGQSTEAGRLVLVQQQQYLFGKEQPGCQKGHRPIKAGHPQVK